MAGLYAAGARARKRRRLTLALIGLGVLALASFLVLRALDQTLLYFRVPSDVLAEKPPVGERFRLGGLVAEGSFERDGESMTARFSVRDNEARLRVVYTGILPDLFREGQGVVTEGALDANGVFRADSVLARHDENYMPKEVADALKRQGVWQHGSADDAAQAKPSADKPGAPVTQ